MRFLHIILLTLLLASCVPSVGQITLTATAEVMQTPTAAPILTDTHTSTPVLKVTTTPAIVSTALETPFPNDDPVLVGAGDIAHCSSEGDEATANLLDNIPGTVFTTGDNVYPDGTPEQFANCYEPSWGRHKERTRPSPGNHDYHTVDASGYFAYFGSAAGELGKGYYSYDLGDWHIIALNSNIPVDPGSAQEQWLREDLAAHTVACTLAYWHHPRFSSGTVHGSDRRMQPLWQALYDFGADVVLAGHEHNYERFAPQDPQGVADPTRGIRQFVVGTGGRSHYSFGPPIANSEVRNGDTHGLLKLTLHSDNYSWEFIPVVGQTFSDSESAPCVTP
jgi:hypothetical protein